MTLAMVVGMMLQQLQRLLLRLSLFMTTMMVLMPLTDHRRHPCYFGLYD